MAKDNCCICEQEYNKRNELFPGSGIFICAKCIELLKENFAWVCLNCGDAIIKNKELVIMRTKDLDLKLVLMMNKNTHFIHFRDYCSKCEPETIADNIIEKFDDEGADADCEAEC